MSVDSKLKVGGTAYFCGGDCGGVNCNSGCVVVFVGDGQCWAVDVLIFDIRSSNCGGQGVSLVTVLNSIIRTCDCEGLGCVPITTGEGEG